MKYPKDLDENFQYYLLGRVMAVEEALTTIVRELPKKQYEAIQQKLKDIHTFEAEHIKTFDDPYDVTVRSGYVQAMSVMSKKRPG
nr:hypothetical protein [uncultured Rhodoferax sp.]